MLQTLQRSRTRSGTAYLDRGEGDETVVLIHGVGMRIEAWKPQIDMLAERCRVIAVDMPGHGASAPLGKTPRLENFVAWFSGVLDDLELGPVNVIGHSMGALIATGIAPKASRKVRRVALLNGVHKRSDAARKAVIARAEEIRTGKFDREAPLARWFSDDEHGTEAYSLVREMLRDVDQGGYAAAYQAFATGDGVYSGCWPDVNCPALFLTGDGDRNSTADMAREMADTAPLGRAEIIVGHRHMVNLTAPGEVNAILIDWLTWETQNDA